MTDSSPVTKQASGRPGRPRSQESEQAILNSVMSILVSRGYHGFTIDKVAEDACVSKATIYRRWRSKEELLVAAMGAVPPIAPRDKGNVIDTLVDFIQQFVEMVNSGPEQRQAEARMITMVSALVSQCSEDPKLMEALHAFIASRTAPIRHILDQAVLNGEIAPPDDMDILIDAIMGPVVLRLFLGDGDVSEYSIRRFTVLALGGEGAVAAPANPKR